MAGYRGRHRFCGVLTFAAVIVTLTQLPAATGPMPAAGSASKSKRPKVTAISDRSREKRTQLVVDSRPVFRTG